MILEAILLSTLIVIGGVLALAMLRLTPLRQSPKLWLLVWALYGLAWGCMPLYYHAKALSEGAHWALLGHIVFAMVSYGFFAVAVVHALLFAHEERSLRLQMATRATLPLLALESLMFRFVALGFFTLSLSLLFGAVAGGAEFFTKLQHKTVFALLSWLVFAALLLGRWRFGWRGRQAAKMLYWGTLLLVLAYVGTRFVLQVLLKRGV